MRFIVRGLIFSVIVILMASVIVVTLPNVYAEEIPDWVRNNASWWSEQQIDDDTFIQGIEYLIKNNHAEVVALSDLKEDKVQKNNDYLKTIQPKGADLYFGGKDEWKKVAERDDIDLLLIATPWNYHTEMSVYGMENGKHVACEQPMAMTLEDCWKLIEVDSRACRVRVGDDEQLGLSAADLLGGGRHTVFVDRC